MCECLIYHTPVTSPNARKSPREEFAAVLLRRRGAAPGARALCPHNRRWAGTLQSPAPAHPAGLGAHSPLRLRTPTRGGPSRPGDCLLTQPQGPRVDVHGGAAQGCRPGRTSPWGKGGKAPPPSRPAPHPLAPWGSSGLQPGSGPSVRPRAPSPAVTAVLRCP